MVQTMRLDAIIDEISRDPASYREGRHLSPEDRAIVKPEDTWVIDFIQTIPEEIARVLSDGAFVFLDMVYYNKHQVETWGKTQKELLRAKLGRDPTQLELMEDADKHRNYQRYRMVHALNFPKNTAVSERNAARYAEQISWFLANACRLDPEHRDYFGIIEANTNEELRKSFEAQISQDIPDFREIPFPAPAVATA